MVEIGKKYRNVHTGIECTVSQKIFFNIQYYDDDDPEHTYPKYAHYKRFQKNWSEIDGNAPSVIK